MNRAAFLLTFLLALPVSAQELKLESIPPGESRITVLREGEPAPYGGQLFDDATALRWANWLRQSKLVYRLDLDAEQRSSELDRQLSDRKLALEREQYNRVVTEYSEKLKKAEEDSRNPPWYRTVEFGAAMGGAAVLVVGISSIWAVGQLNR